MLQEAAFGGSVGGTLLFQMLLKRCHAREQHAGGAVFQERHKVKCLATCRHNKSQGTYCKDESFLLGVFTSSSELLVLSIRNL